MLGRTQAMTGLVNQLLHLLKATSQRDTSYLFAKALLNSCYVPGSRVVWVLGIF